MAITTELHRVAQIEDVRRLGSLVAHAEGHTLALFADGAEIRALDNRCPHMGFPLHRGTVEDGILTCHWHHARFDLATGGTFDPWADDVRSFPVELRDGEVWVDLTPLGDLVEHQRRRLHDGLERNLSLVIAKAAIALEEAGDEVEAFRIGLEFGIRNRRGGWGQGLTMHVCFNNLLSHLERGARRQALSQGLAAVSVDSAASAPRFPIRPLPGAETDLQTLKRWFRRFVEVRDAEGAERCIVSALRTGAGPAALADLLFAAATDHRFIRTGHVLDFTNKAFEALDVAGWHLAEPVLASLASEYANADRMEESNAWRNPVDLVAIVERAFEELPTTFGSDGRWSDREQLPAVLLGDDPQAIADALLGALRDGASVHDLAGAVSEAAAARIARFHTSNEFSDWDTALHSFSFAHAVEQGLRLAPSAELLRGVFDAAMTVYLNRFLNVPPAKLPEPRAVDPQAVLDQLPTLLDRQQQVPEVAEAIISYLHAGGEGATLVAALGSSLAREDRDFHTIQTVEAAVRQYTTGRDPLFLVAAGRYLAAHAPTVRAQAQTFQIAQRLHRGEHLYEDL